jgi:hypothetical protein
MNSGFAGTAFLLGAARVSVKQGVTVPTHSGFTRNFGMLAPDVR